METLRALRLLAAALIVLPAFSASAQDNIRGFGADEGGLAVEGERRALVVGISQYANLPESQQLRYAHRDAEMIYAFLQSEAGGPSDEAVLLRDEEATAARISDELGRLREVSDEGDEVIFYFAGHGDVERVTGAQQGRLLAYDAPPAQNYIGNGGTLSVEALRAIMNSIVQNGARVVIITDACRAGSVNDDMGQGAALTSAVLASDWSRVFRFVSSSAEQLSQEDDALGHGVFTYYLLQGLLGAADGRISEDQQVDRTELQLYVTEQVVRETGSAQAPVISGDPARPLSIVADAVTWESLEALVPPRTERPTYRLLAELSEEDRSARLEDDLPPAARDLVAQFQEALDEGRLLGSDDAADALYERMRGVVPQRYFERFGGTLATALEDHAQATLSGYFRADLLETSDQETSLDDSEAPQQSYSLFSLPLAEFAGARDAMHRALELRGATYAGYASLQGRAAFLEGLVQLLNAEFEASVETLEAVEPPSAFSHNALGYAYYRTQDAEAARASLQDAVALAPNWWEPRRYLGFVEQWQGNYPAALEAYQAAAEQEPDYALLYVDQGEVHERTGDQAAADRLWRQAIEVDPQRALPAISRHLLNVAGGANAVEQVTAYYRLALEQHPDDPVLHTALADHLRQQGDGEGAEASYRTALEVDENHAAGWNGLGILYEVQERYDEAADAYGRAADLAPEVAAVQRNLGDVFRAQERYGEATAAYEEALRLDADHAWAHYGLAMVYMDTDDERAEEHLHRFAVLQDEAAAYNTLGVYYENARRYPQAIAAYEEARARDPEPRHLANLGDAYRKDGQYYRAAEAYAEALALDPAEPLALAGMDALCERGVVPCRERTSETVAGALTPQSPVLDDGSSYEMHRVEAVAGEQIDVLMRSEAFDAYLIFVANPDTPQQHQVAADDDGGGGTDARLSVTAPSTGSYAILANSYGEGAVGPYELVIGRTGDASGGSQGVTSEASGAHVFPGELSSSSPTMDDGSHYVAHALAGEAGETWTVRLESDAFDPYLSVLSPRAERVAYDDDSGGGHNAETTFTLTETGSYQIVANSYDAGSTGPYTLTVTPSGGSNSAPASSITSASGAVVLEGSLTSASPTLDDGSYVTTHEIQVQAGEEVDVSLESDAFDAYLMIMDPSNQAVAQDDDSGGGTNARASFTAGSSGTYSVVVNSYGAGSTGSYRVTVRR